MEVVVAKGLGRVGEVGGREQRHRRVVVGRRREGRGEFATRPRRKGGMRSRRQMAKCGIGVDMQLGRESCKGSD